MVSPRLKSIDVFRALTMFFMVFVNDLWTLKNIPVWLEHVPSGVDGLGFSDIIFPCFLFIVGLSAPHAINSRLARGESKRSVFNYILIRSAALLVMGFFHVNLESYSQAAVLPRPLWQILITASFFLIWLDYPREMPRKRRMALQLTGVLLLAVMAALYTGDSSDGHTWMKPHWWGILGLIGWAYLLCSTIYLFIGKNLKALLTIFILFMIFNMLSHSGWPYMPSTVKHIFSSMFFADPANLSLVMGGIVTSILYFRFAERTRFLTTIFLLAAIALTIFTFATRPMWGISKLSGTPSWVAICMAISLAVFILLIFLVDKRGKESWFRLLRAAGTSTLTCYLLPYFHYALLSAYHLRLPEILRTGGTGIIKSLLYALIIVLITEFLSRYRIRLKV